MAEDNIDRFDPKGLIRESYRIEGIRIEECRSIFLDWALSLPVELSQSDAMKSLMARYGVLHKDHPMTSVLNEGLNAQSSPRRRGGWKARRSS